MGLTLKDMDNVTIGFICELIEDHNMDFGNTDDIVEATTEILDRF